MFSFCSGGLSPGDIVTHINGKEIRHSSDVHDALETSKNLDMTVYRGLNKMQMVVKPEDH